MGPEFIVPMIIASTATSVAGTAYTNIQNKKIAEYQNAQQKAAYEKTLAVSKAQGEITAAERRRQIQGRYDAYRGAIAVSAAERGASQSQSTYALNSALGIQAARESAKVSMEQQLGLQNLAISAMPQWQVAQSMSPFLAGIQGGLQGLSMGLSLQQGFTGLDYQRQMAAAQGIRLT